MTASTEENLFLRNLDFNFLELLNLNFVELKAYEHFNFSCSRRSVQCKPMSVEDEVVAQRAHVLLQHVEADHVRLETLFHTLDHNGDGFIDENELIHYMTSFYGESEELLEEEAKVSR